MVLSLDDVVNSVRTHKYESPISSLESPSGADLSITAYGRTPNEARAIHALLVRICQEIFITPPFEYGLPTESDKPWELEAMLQVTRIINGDRKTDFEIAAPGEGNCVNKYQGYVINVFPVGYDLQGVSVTDRRDKIMPFIKHAKMVAANPSFVAVKYDDHRVVFYFSPK